MRKLIVSSAALAALATGLAGPGSAADSLTVTSTTGSFTLNLAGSAGSNAMGPASDVTSTLSFTTNSPAAQAKSITAQVTATTFPAGVTSHDVTLRVSVAGGAGTLTLINAGGSAAAQTVYTGLDKNNTPISPTVTYTASANCSGTVAGVYVFTVTYTSV